MKRFIILIASLLSMGFVFSQQNKSSQPTAKLPVDPDSKLILYRDVVNEPGTPDILYNRGSGWFSTFYKNPTSIVRIQDKVNGRIEGTGHFMVYYFDETGFKKDGGMIVYDIILELKENKFRYSLTNFNLKTISRYPIEKWLNKNDPAYNSNWDSYLYQVDTAMVSLVKNLKEGMKPKVIKKDEW